jgi:hypothetical protein
MKYTVKIRYNTRPPVRLGEGAWALWRKSARASAIRAWMRWMRDFAFFQLLLPLTLRAMRR